MKNRKPKPTKIEKTNKRDQTQVVIAKALRGGGDWTQVAKAGDGDRVWCFSLDLWVRFLMFLSLGLWVCFLMFLSLGLWVSWFLMFHWVCWVIWVGERRSVLSEGEMECLANRKRQDWEIESIRLDFNLNETEFNGLDFSTPKSSLLLSKC